MTGKKKIPIRTLAQVASEMLKDPNLSERTRTIYTGILLPFLSQYGPRTVSEITRAEVSSFLQSRSHLGYRTFNLSHSVLNRLFNFAVELEEVEISPMQHIKRRKPDKSKGESKVEGFSYLSPKALCTLFRHTEHNLRLSALLHLLHDSGARIAEVLELNESDVDLNTRAFRVLGKGNKSRMCYFGYQGEQILRKYLQRGRDFPHDALFTERLKRSMAVRRLSYATAHKELQVAIGGVKELKEFSFHRLRHTFATERAQIVPIETLRVLLGHENIQTTLIYQKITSEVAGGAARDALAKLGNL